MDLKFFAALGIFRSSLVVRMDIRSRRRYAAIVMKAAG